MKLKIIFNIHPLRVIYSVVYNGEKQSGEFQAAATAVVAVCFTIDSVIEKISNKYNFSCIFQDDCVTTEVPLDRTICNQMRRPYTIYSKLYTTSQPLKFQVE